jgi:polysaccharide pyruvyl transferase WcaK-like protein
MLEQQDYILSRLADRVLLIGGYGVGNAGDEAILRGLIQNMSKKISKLSVTSHSPRETYDLHNDHLPSNTRFNPTEVSPTMIPRLLNDHDHIVVGGGGIFSDYMGPYASKIPLFMLAARMLRKPLYWTAIGVYPSTPVVTLNLLRAAMQRSESVTVRDEISKHTLTNLGLNNVERVLDPSFTLDYEQTETTDNQTIGIAARYVKDSRKDRKLMSVYEEVAETYLDRGWDVVFVPLCQHKYATSGMDQRRCQRLADKYSRASYWATLDPEEMVSKISSFDLMLATRLHSMIFSYIAETPFVEIEYASKCTSILEELDRSDWGISLQDLDSGRVMAKLNEVERDD